MLEPTVARLCAEFGREISRLGVESVLRGCLADLAGNPVGAMPELSERLARQRLIDQLAGDAPLPGVWPRIGEGFEASDRVA